MNWKEKYDEILKGYSKATTVAQIDDLEHDFFVLVDEEYVLKDLSSEEIIKLLDTEKKHVKKQLKD